MNNTRDFIDPEQYASSIEARRQSFLFVLGGYFHPKVICDTPSETCSRIEDTIFFLKRNQKWEEQLMEMSNFPNADEHMQDHQHILLLLGKLKETLVCSAYDNTQISRILQNWETRHHEVFDKPFERYLFAQ